MQLLLLLVPVVLPVRLLELERELEPVVPVAPAVAAAAPVALPLRPLVAAERVPPGFALRAPWHSRKERLQALRS